MAKKPEPRQISPEEITNLALATIKNARFPMLATTDGDQPRVRPVSPVKTDRFTIFVANLRSYHKTKELENNPNVELCYLSTEHNQVRITAKAEVVVEKTVLIDIWDKNPLLRSYLGTIENPALIVYKMVPSRVRFMQEWALKYHEVPL